MGVGGGGGGGVGVGECPPHLYVLCVHSSLIKSNGTWKTHFFCACILQYYISLYISRRLKGPTIPEEAVAF